MLTPAGLWRRAANRIRTRDPDHDGARRALRAAIVIPIAAAVSFAVGGGSQTPLFAIFGSIALLIVVDFPGNMNARALAYGGLGVNGAVLISLGTLAAPIPWLAVSLTFVLGVLVSFSGVLSEIIAAGQRATLLTFVLPVCTPAASLCERLLGWAIALAICVPAALFLFPPRHHGELRRHAAAVCGVLAARIEGTATAADLTAVMDALRANFLGTAYRPVALTAGSRALVRVVDDLQWLCDRVAGDTGRLLGPIAETSVAVLRSCAEVLSISRSADRAAARADLDRAIAVNRLIAVTSYRRASSTFSASPTTPTRSRWVARC